MVATPLGTLGVLPREVRDMIYGYLLGGFYLLAWTVPRRKAWRKANLAILTASKQINAEAMHIFHAASQFVYEFGYGYDFLQKPSSLHPTTDKTFESLMNIKMTVDIRPYYWLMAQEDDFCSALSEISLKRLYRNKIVRNRINIKYFGIDRAMFFNRITSLPLLQEAKHLTCFKSVLLDFFSTAELNIAGHNVFDFEDLKKQHEQSRQYVGAIKADFETTLGSATTIDGLATSETHSSKASDIQSLEYSFKTVDFNSALHFFDWGLEFHPLGHKGKT